MSNGNIIPSSSVQGSATASGDDLRAAGSTAAGSVEPPLQANDKNSAAALQLLREIARSGG